MSIIRVTKEFSFEAAHMLDGYDGLCSQIHGHSYRLFVTVKGEANKDPKDPKYGMVIDFSLLKAAVNRAVLDRYDHSIVIRDSEVNREVIEALKRRFDRIILTPHSPTCENMIVEMASAIATELPKSVELHSLRLYETATSYAEWFAEDNKG